MHASPSIQQIASALARTPIQKPARSVDQPSRILCLKLQELPATGFQRQAKFSSGEGYRAIAEAFLKYSPRVHYRVSEPRGREAKADAQVAETLWVFLDIASTSHLYHGEEGLMRSCMSLARDLGFGVQSAVADTPSGAQAFATAHHGTIVPPGEEGERLKDLPLPLLLQLEGLLPWGKPSTIENIITFFMMLGFKTADDLSRFTFNSLQERWGETGALLWKRLNVQDRQVISPLIPVEPLRDYIHLDFPVSLVSLLLHSAQRSIDFLFARLQGRRYFARKLIVTLHCEYSKTQHKIEIEPVQANRDRELYMNLLEQRLSNLDLENPIRDFEVSIEAVPEKAQQLDFFEPRTTDNDKLQGLLNRLTQSSIQPGFYRIEPSVWPERGWQLASSYTEPLAEPSHLAVVAMADGSTSAVSAQPHYGDSIRHAPRPTRLLREPLPLSHSDFERLKVLSSTPLERIEHGWWENRTGSRPRDYYFAISPEGDCLWIYQDVHTEEYFLHGYFD